ncbi:MAG: twin-arginine translocation signal domain-containing protein [Ardenticatenaceae bacterium]|nr:twin-arginine translocation signal domain-containing protein [Ardenticatenaceae bacterium]
MSANGQGEHLSSSLPKITRRQLLAGAGAAAVAGSIGLAQPAAAESTMRGGASALPVPSPIPGGIDAPPVGFIHWFLPGPTDAMTPFLSLPGFGLDVEPSTLTNFKGFTTFAVISGQATGSDGKTYNVEFDVRVMDGEYVAEDGSHQYGTFGFL